MNKLTQRERLIRYMNDFGSISRAEAMQELGIANATARMSEIRRLGYPLRTRTRYGKNRYNEPVHWTEYYLEDNNNGIQP